MKKIILCFLVSASLIACTNQETKTEAKTETSGSVTTTGPDVEMMKNSFTYFVHGYYASTGEHTIAQTNYILDYSSALHKDNFYGVQFHPEKSAKAGEQIIQNFLSI